MRVLVVKDHAALAGQAAATLEAARFALDHAADGDDALFLGRTEPYDAVELDLGLPHLDGLSVLRGWRTGNRTMPVLTARDAWTGKVEGSTAGADNYLAKALAMGELVARLQALVRRAHGPARPEIVLDPLRVDTAAGRAMLDNALMRLTAPGFRSLAYLALRRGHVVPKTELTEHL